MVQVDTMHAVSLHRQVRNIQPGDSTSFIANSNQVCSLSWERQLPHTLGPPTVSITLRNVPG